MKKIDFSKVPVEYRIGEPEATDVRRTLGNTINQNTSDIALADLARKIYYSEEPVEIPGEYVGIVADIVSAAPNLLASAKVAILALINGTNESEKSKENEKS